MDFEFALKTAQTFLNKLEFEDAEEKFCCLLSDLNNEERQKHHNESKKVRNASLLEVECLIGIAECRSKSFKMGRYLKDDFWFQCFILPLCLLSKSRQLCRSILGENIDPKQTDESTEDHQTVLRNRLNRLDFQISSLEDNFVRGFLRKTFNSNNIQQAKLDSSISINKNWIMDLMKVCDVADVNGWSKKKIITAKANHDVSEISNDQHPTPQNETKTGNNKLSPQHKLKTSQSFKQQRQTFSNESDSKEKVKSEKTLKSRDISPNPSAFSSKTRTINFEHFQDAIQSFVSEISSEVRSRYGHLSKVPESMIERRLASEIALRLSPGSIQAEDYINVLEGALVAGINGPVEAEIDDQDVNEAERLAELERLEKEKQRLLALDDEMDEDQESYETLHLDIGGLLQISGSKKVRDVESSTETQSKDSQHEVLRWSAQSVQKDESLSHALVPSSKDVLSSDSNEKSLALVNLPRTLKKLRQDILFVWRKLQSKQENEETCRSDIKSKDKNIGKHFFLMKENHFEELSNLNQNIKNAAEEINKTKIIIEDDSWPFAQMKKSNVISMFLELIVKAAQYESNEMRHLESVELLQIADQIINEIWSTSNLEKDAKETISLVWTNLGEELSKTGQVSKGSSYLEKRKALSPSQGSESNASKDEIAAIFEEVEGWCKLADAYLGEDLRSESLLARLMQLTKQELTKRDEGTDNEVKHVHQFLKDLYRNENKDLSRKFDDDDEDTIGDDDDDDDKEQKDDYCTCLQEAVDYYSIAASILQSNRSVIGASRPELWSEILTKLADCHLMSGNLDLAEVAYDEALDHVSRAVGPEHLKRNANAILALATLCFLTGNDVRACTLLLTSLALRGKYCDKRSSKNVRNDYNNLDPYSLLKIYDSKNALDLDDEDTDFGTVWTLMVLSLSHHSLGKPYQAISWASRAFQAHGKFFHGRIVAVDPLNRWFLVRILISLATNNVILSNPLESINRLIFAQKFLEVSKTVDRIQLSQIFKISGDANLLLSNGVGLKSEVTTDENALRKYSEKSEGYYSKALELLRYENNQVHFEKLSEMIKLFKTHRCYTLDNKLDKFDSPQLQITWKEIKNEIETKSQEIKSKCDLILILLEMANDHVMNYNLDQSLACFVECSKELEKSWTAERSENEGFLLASVYFRLGRLLHVKYLMSCDQPEELQCYSDASIRIFNNADKIALSLIDGERLHFDILLAKSLLLYDLGRKYDAVQTMLPILLKHGDADDCDDVVFSGQEIFALPKQLRSTFGENSFDSTLVIRRRSLLGLLATTCYKEINLMDYATEAICPMIIAYNLKSEYFLDNIALSFSFMNLKFYDEAYRVFSDISRFCEDSATRIYLAKCAYICLLLHLRFHIKRVMSIALEQTFANLKKTFRLLTFNEFLSKLFTKSAIKYNTIKTPRKISVRSTFPKVPHVEWRSGSCSQQENARKSPNSVSFKIETGIRSINEIPNKNVYQSSDNTKLQTPNRHHPANQMFRVI